MTNKSIWLSSFIISLFVFGIVKSNASYNYNIEEKVEIKPKCILTKKEFNNFIDYEISPIYKQYKYVDISEIYSINDQIFKTRGQISISNNIIYVSNSWCKVEVKFDIFNCLPNHMNELTLVIKRNGNQLNVIDFAY